MILSPSPKGYSTAAKLLEFIHAEFARIGAPADLVQTLPHPVTKESSQELMRQCDRILATGGTPMVQAAYSSGTPALGVGVGNAVITVDDTADLDDAAEKIRISKTLDLAASCSSDIRTCP